MGAHFIDTDASPDEHTSPTTTHTGMGHTDRPGCTPMYTPAFATRAGRDPGDSPP